MNSAFNYTLAYTWHTVKSALVQQTLPQNAGTMRPIRARRARGLLVQPAAAGGGGRPRGDAAAHRRRDPPGPRPGHSRSRHRLLVPLGESHRVRDRPREGAPLRLLRHRRRRDGGAPAQGRSEAVCGSFNVENIPVEVNESNYPVLIERLELIADSAGAGKYRGSCGLRKDIRFLGVEGSISNLSDRHRFRPPGLFGGEPGALGRTLLNPGTPGEQELHAKAIYPLAHGDLVSIRLSGSGGYGDPRQRDRRSSPGMWRWDTCRRSAPSRTTAWRSRGARSRPNRARRQVADRRRSASRVSPSRRPQARAEPAGAAFPLSFGNTSRRNLPV